MARFWNGNAVSFDHRRDWTVMVNDTTRALTHWAEGKPPITIGCEITCHVQNWELGRVNDSFGMLVVDQLRNADRSCGPIIGMYWARVIGPHKSRGDKRGYSFRLRVEAVYNPVADRARQMQRALGLPGAP